MGGGEKQGEEEEERVEKEGVEEEEEEEEEGGTWEATRGCGLPPPAKRRGGRESVALLIPS